MNEISKRLHKIAELIPPGLKVADIGSDHAYLPTYLVQSGRTRFVIAGEVNEGPYQSAFKQIEAFGLQEYVKVRKGNGLHVLNQNEVDLIVIAGMGGCLIVQILSDDLEKLNGVKHLVLQPNVGEELVRKFGLNHGWELSEEVIIEEDDHIYEILSFVRGNSKAPYMNQEFSIDLLLKMGPFLIKRQGVIFQKKWMSELRQMENILTELSKSEHPNAIEKRERLFHEYNQIKEVLR